MPDKPENNRRVIKAAGTARPATIGYAELHCKTNFSFLEGASHADELVKRAAELGYTALAITDRNSLAGVVRAHVAAKGFGLKLLIGAEITPIDAPAIVLLATDRAAYGRLSRLITLGRRNAPKGECRITFDDVACYAEGLLAGVFDQQATLADLSRYREVFPDRCYRLIELHRGPKDQCYLEENLQLAKRAGIPPVASGGVLFHQPERQPLCDVLTAVRAGCTVAEAGERLFPNAERYLKCHEQITEQFASAAGAVERTVEIADRCTFTLDQLRYEYPEELSPHGQTPFEYLTQLTRQGAKNRYPDGVPKGVRKSLEHELKLIRELHYEAYFLTVWDLVRFARSRNILCQGRGSAANSAVCYCLGVTAIDPECIDLLFERFISKERDEAPDIDVDFEHARREEVIQYVYEKYGRERAGMTAEVITYRPRSAVRDVGKALGLSLDRIDALAKTLNSHKAEGLCQHCRRSGLDPESHIGRQLVELVGELIGFPRHLGQHVGGMVMTQGPLCELVPIENASMADRTVIEWDKNDLDEIGILKVDCLALGMLTAIHKSFDLVQQHYDREITLADIPEEDLDVYDMICKADTIGVFQIESRAQMSMLPRLRPRTFYDLVIEVAIVRPGPIQGDMVHPFLRRREGKEEVTYPNDEIEKVLHKTLGVPLFQEQAMKLAIVAAGFTPSEADQLRRAMAGWRRPGLIEHFKEKLLEGMKANGLSKEFAERLFRQIEGFGEYGFPESHAASFALLAYASSWLKFYYPAVFCAALLNSQPMGFYGPAQLIRDAQEHGVEVRSADINHSDWDCTLEPTTDGTFALRLGLRLIDGLGSAQAQSIEEQRKRGLFCSLTDFTQRTGFTQTLVARLATADAFQSLRLNRRNSLWQALAQEKRAKYQPLFCSSNDEEETLVALPRMSKQEEVFADYQATGLSLKGHPLAFYRAELNELHIVPTAKLADLKSDQLVRVAGLVLVRQRPGTASGITFVTLEDETGIANLIVHKKVWERYNQVARTARGLIAHGRLQKQDLVIHILISKLESLEGCVNEMKSQSRDFH
jgi:error-prone DNA polymerase